MFNRFYCCTNAYNFVAFVDSRDEVYVFDDGQIVDSNGDVIPFNCSDFISVIPLLVKLQEADYSAIDGCSLACEINDSIGTDYMDHVFPFDSVFTYDLIGVYPF